MAAEYAKKTNAELVELLKARSLPHNGKKAEMVARLEEDDAKEPKTDGAPTTAAKNDNTEDVIDWEDDGLATTAPSTETGAAAIAAGGQGSVANPATVPNQQLGEDPAKTGDLKVEAQGAAHNGEAEAPAEGAAAPAEQKPVPNFAKGLPVSEFEEELRKRKARAEKFGITEDSQTAIAEAEKQLERAKRFGIGGTEGNPNIGVRGLDEALPMERAHKRGRGDNENGGRGGKRRNFGGRNNVSHRGRIQKPSGGNNGQVQWSEKDTAALEARKKRFGAAT